MKQAIILIIILGVIAFFVFRKDKSGESENMEEVSGESISENLSGNYEANTEESTASWTGSKKILVEWIDKGNINISGGELVLKDGEIESGEIVFDMNSISAKSTGSGEGEDQLSGHLKSEDFFNAEKYPEAIFVVSEATKGENDVYNLSGNLTIKETTKPYSLLASILEDGDKLVVTGNAVVNRAEFDVKFGSETFFDNLGDNVINDDFDLEFRVVFEK